MLPIDTGTPRTVATWRAAPIRQSSNSSWAGGGREARYLITDWGDSMGRWGGNIVTRGCWDPEGFENQTPQFVAEEGIVKFGYIGQRTEDVSVGITTEDVRWLCRSLARITDSQLVSALRASGGSDEEAARFSAAVRNRIEQLRRACAA